MSKLRVAVIGCGTIYGIHADAIVSNPYAELVCVADIKEDRAKIAAEKYHTRYYSDYKKMLEEEEVDVVHICTPHYLHAPMALDALRAGKHVLVEKPVAMNGEQAQEMVVTAKEYGKYLGVAFQNRYNNTSVKAKEILSQGSLGQIKGIKGLVTWHRNKPYYTESDWRGRFATEGGGVLINQAIHTLDLMQWLAGDIQAIKGHIDTRVLDREIEVEDTADATVYYHNGTIGIFYATTAYTTNSSIEVEIHCDKGILNIKNGNLTMEINGVVEHIIDDHHNGKYKSYWGDSHRKLIEQFYHCIIHQNETGYISGQDGMIALQMIEGIYKSSAEGNKIFF